MKEPVVIGEQFVPDHVFFYVWKGVLQCYDGNKNYTFKAGAYCLARKNHLARYRGEKGKEFEVISICFEEDSIKKFQAKHQKKKVQFNSKDAFIKIAKSDLVPEFIRSLKPYYHHGNIDDAFAEVKQEELLIILLQNQSQLAGVFFDYAIPQKIDLKEFMNRNYQFNVSLQRFAYLTGRSLSAFKRDFKQIFNETPSRWLLQSRLQEAHFLITKKQAKPSDIYLDLGFETLSHFSFAFKNKFGQTPTQIVASKSD